MGGGEGGGGCVMKKKSSWIKSGEFISNSFQSNIYKLIDTRKHSMTVGGPVMCGSVSGEIVCVMLCWYYV